MNWMTVSQTVGRAVREPQRLRRIHHSKVLALAHSVLEPDDFELMGRLFRVKRERLIEIRDGLLGDAGFRQAVEAGWRRVRGTEIELFGKTSVADYCPLGRLLYYSVRLLRPHVVVDTGVLDGFTSAFILKALEDNGEGRLRSIDLPAYCEESASSDKMRFGSLPAGREPGWIIPEGLRERWTLRKGPSRELLEGVLKEAGQIDLFYHDSLHTYENMLWEYTVAWPYLREGGLLVSDDIFWNRAFWVFARQETVQARVIKHGAGWARKIGGS